MAANYFWRTNIIVHEQGHTVNKNINTQIYYFKKQSITVSKSVTSVMQNDTPKHTGIE